MSVARLYTVKKSRKDQKPCESCKMELPAGTPYLYYYVGFRSNYKHVRCTKSECFPKPSERESSKTATILAAQESFDVSGMDTKDDIEAAVQAVGDSVQEVADEYQEALDAWENGNSELEEKVSHYEDQANEISNWTYEGEAEPEQEEDEDEEAFQERWDEWIEQVRSEAQDAVDNIEFA